MEFHKIQIEDVAVLDAFFRRYGRPLCDDTVCATYMWRNYLGAEMCVEEDTLYIRVRQNDSYVYTLPLGPNTEQALKKVMDLPQNGNTVQFYPILSNELSMFAKLFRNTSIIAKQDWYDYVYLCEDLVQFKGKKYHTQKNHVNRFLASYQNWKLVEFSPEYIKEVIQFEKKFISELYNARPMEYEENYRTLEVLEQFQSFNLVGYLLYVGDRIVAYELGEVLKDTFYAHIEKADRTVQGAYTMIVHEVAKQLIHKNVKFINREEDVGDAGLRYSKRQYRPTNLVIKHRVSVIEKEM